MRKNGSRAKAGDHRGTDVRGPSLTRRRCAGLLIWGGACISMATYLPWVVVRFDWGWWPRTGMQLTYAHFPPITIGYVAFVLGGSAILLGRAEARTPGYAELAILPAGLTAFFLWFINPPYTDISGGRWILSRSLGRIAWSGLLAHDDRHRPGCVWRAGSCFHARIRWDRILWLPSKRSSCPGTRPLATSSARVPAHEQVARSSSST